MRYIAVTPVQYPDGDKQKTIRPGRTVPAELVDDSLIGSGAIMPADDGDDDAAVNGQGDSAPRPKPLSKMNKPELAEVAAGEGVEIPDGTSNADMVKLIEAKRAGSGS